MDGISDATRQHLMTKRISSGRQLLLAATAPTEFSNKTQIRPHDDDALSADHLIINTDASATEIYENTSSSDGSDGDTSHGTGSTSKPSDTVSVTSPLIKVHVILVECQICGEVNRSEHADDSQQYTFAGMHVCETCSETMGRDVHQVQIEAQRQSLTRWLIFKVIDREFATWLGCVPAKACFSVLLPDPRTTRSTLGSPQDNSLMGRLYKTLLNFPLFRGAGDELADSLRELFQLLPDLDKRLRKARGRGMHERLSQIVAGPIYYATFSASISATALPTGSQPQSWAAEQSATMSSQEQQYVTNQQRGPCQQQQQQQQQQHGDARNNPKLAHVRAARGSLNEQFRNRVIELLSATSQQGGIHSFVNAIEGAHSIEELPLFIRNAFEAHMLSSLANVEFSLQKPINRSKLQSLYRIFPRRTVLAMLKLNAGARVAGSTISIFLAKPFGGYSLLQHVTSEMMGVKRREKLAAASLSRLPPAITRLLIKQIKGGVPLLVPGMTDDEILNILNEGLVKAGNVVSEFRSAQGTAGILEATRLYVEYTDYVVQMKALVDMLGSTEVENVVRKILPIVQRKLVSSMTAKGDGLVEFAEVIFRSWKRIVSAHKDKSLDATRRREVYWECVVSLHEQGYTLLRHLVRSDRGGIWHDIIRWVVRFWESSEINVDVENLIARVCANNPKLQQEIERESVLAHQYFTDKANHPPDTPLPPMPELPIASQLVPSLAHELVDQMLPGVHVHVPTPRRSHAHQQHNSISAAVRFVTSIEVVFSGEPYKPLQARGFDPLDGNTNYGSRGGATHLWLRSRDLNDTLDTSGTFLPYLAPIVDVVVATSTKQVRAYRADGYVVVNRNLNRGSMHHVTHLLYKRSYQPERVLTGLSLCVHNEERNAVLRLQGWVCVAESVNRARWRFRNPVYLWALYVTDWGGSS